jgi:D-glycero-alpha-D-manno-heptose-7-phosphate kinase
LNCLHHFKGDPQLSALELAAEASNIELDYVKSPIGLQDQYGCAVGGLKSIQFAKGREVSLHKLDEFVPLLRNLFTEVLFFWTGTMRSANTILDDQSKNTTSKLSEVTAMVEIASQLESNMRQGITAQELGQALDQSWALKKTLSERISYSLVDQYYDTAKSLGAYGGKLLGAGGGGFLLLFAPTDCHHEITTALSEFLAIDVQPTLVGTQILVDSM